MPAIESINPGFKAASKKLRNTRWIRSGNQFFYPERFGNKQGFSPQRALELDKEWGKNKLNRLESMRKA